MPSSHLDLYLDGGRAPAVGHPHDDVEQSKDAHLFAHRSGTEPLDVVAQRFVTEGVGERLPGIGL